MKHNQRIVDFFGLERGLRVVALSLVLTSCVVSFDDYPVGELSTPAEAGGAGGLGTAGKGGVKNGSGGDGDSHGDDEPTDGGDDPTNGEGGAGGAPSGTVELDPDLIDDFEDGDGKILPNDGRSGSWYVSNDGTGMQAPKGDVKPEPLMPERDGSERALHTSGRNFRIWGAVLGANLRAEGNSNQPYDASRYTGVRFWARSGDGMKRSAYLSLPTSETTRCPGCRDHFGTKFEYEREWKEFRLPFSEMKQRGVVGMPRPKFDARQIVAIEFTFDVNVEFDLWIDDIGFY